MSNCIHFEPGLEILLSNQHFDTNALMNHIKAHSDHEQYKDKVQCEECHSIPYWYLSDVELIGDGIIWEIENARSGHTFHSFQATLLYLGKFCKENCEFTLKMSDESDGFVKWYDQLWVIKKT